MHIIDATTAAETPNPHQVSTRLLLSTPHAMVVLVTLEPGEALKRHTTPVDVFFYILQGRGVVEIGDESQEVSADMRIESPAKIPHRLSNPGQETFCFLVGKTPRPTEQTRIL
jgi:quercetin dioxygenase-like cupin family protein